MNRFSVHYATNDSMTKAGNVRGICNIFLSLMTVCRQSSSQNYTKKEKNYITLYVKDLSLLVKALDVKANPGPIWAIRGRAAG